MKVLFLTFFIIYSSLWAVSLKTPESIAYDKTKKKTYISSTGNGMILELTKNKEFKEFASGLESPKGLCISKGCLFTTDVTRVKGFEIKSGKLKYNFVIKDAQFLNDITSDDTGNLYVSDMKTNKIHIIHTATFKITTFASQLLNAPNGLIYEKERLLIVCFSKKAAIVAMNLKDKKFSIVKQTDLAYLDGFCKDKFGNYYVSSWESNAIFMLDRNFANLTKIADGYSGPADILYLKDSNTILIPDMNNSEIKYLELNQLEKQ